MLVHSDDYIDSYYENVQSSPSDSRANSSDPLIERYEEESCLSRWCIPTRYVIAILASLGFAIVYFLRVNLSVAMVVMVNGSALHANNTTGQCPNDANLGPKSHPDGPFIWDENKQGLILAAFFWGYIPLQIPAGYISQKFGGKWLYGIGVLWTSLLTLLTPLAAEAGYLWLILLRTLEGLGESITYPAVSSLLGKWSPPNENSFLCSLAFSGSLLGMVAGTLISGYLIDWGILGGWPSVFYIPGGVGAVWFLLWSIFAYSEPATHPRLAKREKDFIEQSINLSSDHEKLRTPWCKILLSPPVWAISVSSISFLFSINTLLSSLPQYFKYILNFSIDQNGLLSSLPYMTMGISGLIISKICDMIRSKNILSTMAIRRIVNTIGLLGNALFLVATGYVNCNRTLAIVFLCLGSFVIFFTAAGFNTNHLDLSPKYAGTIYGITNSIGSVSGILAPIIVGALTNNQQTRGQWQKVFYITAGVSAFGAIFYLIFGSGNRQPWADGDNNMRNKEITVSE